MSGFVSLDNLRAKEAADIVGKAVNETPDVNKAYEFRVEIEALPARLMQNGLLQTLYMLFEMSPEKGDRRRLAKGLYGWLNKRLDLELPDEPTIQRALDFGKPENLAKATEEALKLCYWLKLMAKASIPKPQKDKGTN